jgi:type II secretory pathway component PulC
MARYVSWFANLSLGALACFLLAQTINTVVAASLSPSPVGIEASQAEGATEAGAPRDPQIILSRNLFNASTLSPEAGALPAEEEDLEATQLPLTLLGTAASEVPELSWAAIEDRESQQTLVLRIGDGVRNQAQVRRIERKRIVLEERGTLRELALAEVEGVAASPRASLPVSARSRPRGPRVTPQAAPPAESPRSPAQLFSEARALLHGLDGQVEASVGRHDEDERASAPLTVGRHEFDAPPLGHAHVAQDDVGGLFERGAQPRLPVLGLHDFVSGVHQNEAE